MKVGKLINLNEKGQIVIPQEYRDLLGMKANMTINIIPYKTGIFIQPITKVLSNIASSDMYSKVLEKTTGAWAENETEQTGAHDLELKASERRKTEW